MSSSPQLFSIKVGSSIAGDGSIRWSNPSLDIRNAFLMLYGMCMPNSLGLSFSCPELAAICLVCSTIETITEGMSFSRDNSPKWMQQTQSELWRSIYNLLMNSLALKRCLDKYICWDSFIFTTLQVFQIYCLQLGFKKEMVLLLLELFIISTFSRIGRTKPQHQQFYRTSDPDILSPNPRRLDHSVLFLSLYFTEHLDYFCK